MCAIGKLQTRQSDISIAFRQIGPLRHINAVHIETHGAVVHAGGVFTGRIAERSAQVEGTAVDRAVVSQLLTVDGDGGDLRVVDVIHVRTVHKLEVIKVNRPNPGLDHLSALHKHKAEGHSLLHGNGCR